MCGDGWTSQWSDLVCELLGAASSVSTEMRRVVDSVPRPRVKLSPNASPGADKPLQYILKSDCFIDSLVHLSCEQHCEFPQTVTNFCGTFPQFFFFLLLLFIDSFICFIFSFFIHLFCFIYICVFIIIIISYLLSCNILTYLHF